jgi:hypothetical protein
MGEHMAFASLVARVTRFACLVKTAVAAPSPTVMPSFTIKP